MTEDTESKEPKRGVGTVAMESIAAGLDNAETLEAVKAGFPKAKTSLASINWYRNKARADGVKGPDGNIVKTARELKKAKASEGKDPLD